MPEDLFANVFHYLNCWARSTGKTSSGSVEHVVNIIVSFSSTRFLLIFGIFASP